MNTFIYLPSVSSLQFIYWNLVLPQLFLESSSRIRIKLGMNLNGDNSSFNENNFDNWYLES